MMEGTSASYSHLHPTNLWKKKFEVLGQTMNISYNEDQRWYYLRNHGVDEVTFIKIWDNDQNAQAQRKENFKTRCIIMLMSLRSLPAFCV